MKQEDRYRKILYNFATCCWENNTLEQNIVKVTKELKELRDKEWIEILENTFEPTVPMTLSYEKWVEIKSKMEKK